ncbi:MAG TPA: glycerophosphodiester phosphodiesterase [Longimicrobiales bacterium]|nr:glycerophosphodiester phosphodiesterase [Longimicrobiales bacterium]
MRRDRFGTGRAAHPVLAGAPHVIGHRGAAGLYPENTLYGFRRAAEEWRVDMIELDVRASADGHCVVIHDATVDRTTDGTGAVAELTLEELRRLDAGYRFTPDGGRSYPFRGQGIRIPTIGEVLEALPTMRFVVEVKEGRVQRPLLDALLAAGATDRVIVAGERHEDRTLLFAEYPGPVSGSVEQLARFSVLTRLRLDWLWAPRIDVASVPEVWKGRRVVTPKLIRDFHRHGIAVQVWTVNEPEDMERLLDWGVDGIVTDRPDLLREVLLGRAERVRRGAVEGGVG